MRVSAVLFCLTLSAIACGCRPYAQPQPVIYCPTRCVTTCPQQSPCVPAPVSAGQTLEPVPDRATSSPPGYVPQGSPSGGSYTTPPNRLNTPSNSGPR